MKSLIRYQGGKKRIAPAIVREFPSFISGYAEPFVGSGAVYMVFRKLYPNNPVILGDLNRGITSVWECLHSHTLFPMFRENMEKMVAVPKTNEQFLTFAQKAPPDDPALLGAQFLWMQMGSFKGKPVFPGTTDWTHYGCTFDTDRRYREKKAAEYGVDSSGAVPGTAKRDFSSILSRMEKGHRLLRNCPTEIHHGSFDGMSAPVEYLIYADPPYANTTGYAANSKEGWDQDRFDCWVKDRVGSQDHGGLFISGDGKTLYPGSEVLTLEHNSGHQSMTGRGQPDVLFCFRPSKAFDIFSLFMDESA